ncbi:FAD-dependent oxidoreductase [Nonomuraea endophytica]|uniref:FAD-dependent oxidoreductase n=1 Tax=Nonomuraea endophytica TaxID=714136 RepID=UPI0037C9CB34
MHALTAWSATLHERGVNALEVREELEECGELRSVSWSPTVRSPPPSTRWSFTYPMTAGAATPVPASCAFGPGGAGLFLSLHDPASGSVIYPAACAEVAPISEHGWSAPVRALVRAADPATAAFFGFHTADADADLTPWPVGVVTALGDAVHAMPPTGGVAAATAIRDADVLAHELIQVRDGMSTIPLAVHRFQTRMAGYAPAAVRISMQPLCWINRLATPLGTQAARLALPALASAARLGRTLAGARSA